MICFLLIRDLFLLFMLVPSCHLVLFNNIVTVLFTTHRVSSGKREATFGAHRRSFGRMRCRVNREVMMELNNTHLVAHPVGLQIEDKFVAFGR
jgi:hypothetical protein